MPTFASSLTRRAALTAAALAAVSVLPTAAHAQGKEVRIAHIYSKTGPLEAYGKQTATGFMMGLEYATGGTMTVAGKKLVVLDIPLLFEGMGERRVDATLVVSAPPFLQRHRVMARPGMTATRLDGILRQQVPDAVKRRKASIVIPTGLGLAPTRAALARAVTDLRGMSGRFWPPNPWREKFTAQLARARRNQTGK